MKVNVLLSVGWSLVGPSITHFLMAKTRVSSLIYWFWNLEKVIHVRPPVQALTHNQSIRNYWLHAGLVFFMRAS